MRRNDGQSSPRGIEAAMTFEEIGRAMGLTRGGAWMLYKTAMRKLRKQKLAIKNLAEMVAAKEREG